MGRLPTEIDAVIASAEGGQYLVANSARPLAYDIHRVLGVDEIGEPAGLDQPWIEPSDVERDQIHRDASDYVNLPTRDAGHGPVLGRAKPPVGVADRDSGNPTPPIHAMLGTVANGLTSVNVADLNDSSL